MKGFELTNEALKELRLAHRKARRTSARLAYKINAIILLGSGWTLSAVREALLLDDETLSNYLKKYRTGGVDALSNTKHQGRKSFLSAEEQALFCQEVDSKIYLTVQSLVEWVKRTFKVSYTVSGMRDLLHRLDYVYKKPKLVPGKPDSEAQEAFVTYFKAFMMKKPSDTEVLFMDAVHPEHNALAAYGWIKRGEKRALKTNSGRARLNLQGAINAETYQLTLMESKTVNAESTLDFLGAVERAYPLSKAIFIILDNARYHYSKSVRKFLKGTKIRLIFLPSYSPNLNLIERIWKFFKKKVLYNRYHENLKAFRKACINFFKNFEMHHEQVARLMSSEFELA